MLKAGSQVEHKEESIQRGERKTYTFEQEIRRAERQDIKGEVRE